MSAPIQRPASNSEGRKRTQPDPTAAAVRAALTDDEREALRRELDTREGSPRHRQMIAHIERIIAAHIVQARAGEGALRERVDPNGVANGLREAVGQDGWFAIPLASRSRIVRYVAALTPADPS